MRRSRKALNLIDYRNTSPVILHKSWRREGCPAPAARAPGDHAERREDERPAEEPGRGVVHADDHDEADRPEHHDQGQQAHEDTGRDDPGNLRRGLQVHLAGRGGRGGQPGAATEDGRPHPEPPGSPDRVTRTHAGVILRTRAGDGSRSGERAAPGPRGGVG